MCAFERETSHVDAALWIFTFFWKEVWLIRTRRREKTNTHVTRNSGYESRGFIYVNYIETKEEVSSYLAAVVGEKRTWTGRHTKTAVYGCCYPGPPPPTTTTTNTHKHTWNWFIIEFNVTRSSSLYISVKGLNFSYSLYKVFWLLTVCCRFLGICTFYFFVTYITRYLTYYKTVLLINYVNKTEKGFVKYVAEEIFLLGEISASKNETSSLAYYYYYWPMCFSLEIFLIFWLNYYSAFL